MTAILSRSLLVALAFVAGCATFSDSAVVMDQALRRDAPRDALAALERQHVPPRDEVLHLMNKAMLQRIAGDFAESNATFEAAKRRIDALEAISVSEQTGALLVNDATRAYLGAPFERAFIHIYSALNYLALDNIDGARVEVLQLDVTLKQLATTHAELADFAFARLFSGLVYDALGERSDALIAYRQAYEDYRAKNSGTGVPAFLGRRLVQLTRDLGIFDEQRRFEREFGGARDNPSDVGEAVMILSVGIVPAKREHSVTVPNPTTGRWFRIAQPYYPPLSNAPPALHIVFADATTDAALAADVAVLAQDALAVEMPKITARTVARLITKDIAARQAAKRNDVLGAALNIANVLTERADTRSWTTLPAHIYVAVLPLKAGHYPVRIESEGRMHDYAIDVRAGHKTFIAPHWPAG